HTRSDRDWSSDVCSSDLTRSRDNSGGEKMETIKEPMVEYGVAKLALPGHAESGDHHVVRCNRNGVLIAAIDGIGHGEEAADAAKIGRASCRERVEIEGWG